jgi:hypothetical protein
MGRRFFPSFVQRFTALPLYRSRCPKCLIAQAIPQEEGSDFTSQRPVKKSKTANDACKWQEWDKVHSLALGRLLMMMWLPLWESTILLICPTSSAKDASSICVNVWSLHVNEKSPLDSTRFKHIKVLNEMIKLTGAGWEQGDNRTQISSNSFCISLGPKKPKSPPCSCVTTENERKHWSLSFLSDSLSDYMSCMCHPRFPACICFSVCRRAGVDACICQAARVMNDSFQVPWDIDFNIEAGITTVLDWIWESTNCMKLDDTNTILQRLLQLTDDNWWI